jgi:hypothetical protein
LGPLGKLVSESPDMGAGRRTPQDLCWSVNWLLTFGITAEKKLVPAKNAARSVRKNRTPSSKQTDAGPN